MKKWYKLDDIANFNNISNYFAATGTPTLDAEASQLTLWTEDDFEEIFDRQSEKSILLKETETPWADFKSKYTVWLNRNKNYIANELYTLLKKFNPIYNYDRHEEYSGDDTTTKTPDNWKTTRTETPDEWKRIETQKPAANWEKSTTRSYDQYKETDTETPDEWKKTVSDKPTNWKKTTQTQGNAGDNGGNVINAVVPFNGSDFVNMSKSTEQKFENKAETQAGQYDVEETQTGEYTRTHEKEGTETVTETAAGTYAVETTEEGSRVETTEQEGTFEDKVEYGKVVDIVGNIGVTTTAQMIKEVLTLYDTDFIERWLMRFFNTYCCYVKE